jgi:hypothetical protein
MDGVVELDPRIQAALIGAVIAGIFAFGGGWLAHYRDAKRRDFEWSREKLLECYSNSIYYLVKLSITAQSQHNAKEFEDLRQHFSETQRNLNLLMAYRFAGNLGNETLNNCTKNLAGAWGNNNEISSAADNTIAIVKTLFERDERVGIRETA